MTSFKNKMVTKMSAFLEVFLFSTSKMSVVDFFLLINDKKIWFKNLMLTA